MATLKLSASSLIEAIVASVIFLFSFCIAMQIITQLTVSDIDPYTHITMEVEVRNCLLDFSDGEHQFGQYIKEYDWGSIRITVAQYRNFDSLQELTITAIINSNKRTIDYKYLIEKHDE